jgi:hypothetical protein
VGALLHAQDQTFFYAVASPGVSKTTFSAGKVVGTIFWDSKGVLYMDFLTERHKINTEYYSALLKGPVKSHQEQEKKGTNISVISPG